MADNRNFAALDWLIPEISETLQEARQTLEAYVENAQDVVQLRACLTYIHQVHGSLQMMEFFGAAMLADEMERLAQAMIVESVSEPGEAQEVLMRGILQFPPYLEQLKLSRNDNPLIVLPLLNDLRAVRGESLLTDSTLFVPDLAPAKKISGGRSTAAQDNVQFQAMALKLRQMFQYAAAGFIRGVSTADNLAYLQKVFLRLHKLTQGSARHALWDICLALAEALENDVLEMSAALKNLLRQLDKEIKILAVYGIKSLSSYTSDELIKNLLYYVARAGKNTSHFQEASQLKRIYETYNLANALIEGGGQVADQHFLAAPDSAAMRSVTEALKTELETVKLALDECISDELGQQRLGDIAPVIKRIADTMAVLGLGLLRKRVLEQGAALELMASANRALSQDELLLAAGNIIAIENELESLAQSQPAARNGDPLSENDITLARAKEAVLHESRMGLEKTKNAIVEYIASQWDRKHLLEVPSSLREVRGGLGIIPLPEAARIIAACTRYIEEQLLAEEETPQWSKLDSLADAIASIEYYLERLSSGATQEENDILLSLAEESVALLGYGNTSQSSTAVLADEPDLDFSDEESAPLDTEMLDADEAHLAAAYQSALKVESLEDVSTDAAISGALAKMEAQAGALDIPPYENFTLESQETNQAYLTHEKSDDREADSQVGEPEADYVVAPIIKPSLQGDSGEEDEVDEEIIEIFVEEAGEVLTAIQKYFPLWAGNFSDVKSLAEFRRAFHTLKGSGRMVNAVDIGRLGWAIENMLNRLLDKSIEPAQAHVSMVEKVCEILPAMISAFSQHQENPKAELTDQYCAMAELLAQGQVPEELRSLAPPTLASETEDASVAALPVEVVAVAASDNTDEEQQLWDIFAGETLTHLQIVEEFISHMQAEAPCYQVLGEDVQRALHTLKGSAYMAGVTSIAELVAPLEKLAKDLRSYQVLVGDDILQLLKDAVRYIHAALDKIAARKVLDIPEAQAFFARVGELHDLYIEPLVLQQGLDESQANAVDPKILSMFMTEELSSLLDADNIIARWQLAPLRSEVLQPLLNELRQLTRGARLASLPPLEALSEKAEHLYEHILMQHLSCTTGLCEVLNQVHIALLDMMDTIAAGQNLSPASVAVQAALEDWITQADANLSSLQYSAGQSSIAEMSSPEEASDVGQLSVYDDADLARDEVTTDSDVIDSEPSFTEAAVAPLENSSADDESSLDAGEDIVAGVLPSPVEDHSDIAKALSIADALVDETLSALAQQERLITEDITAEIRQLQAPEPSVRSYYFTGTDDDEDFDPEIIEIFIEEALELLEDIERALHNWQEDISNPQPLEELKRYLHTFKGGARLAGLAELGDLAHDIESQLIEIDDTTDINQALFAKFNDYQDLLHKAIAQTRIHLDADYALAEELEREASAAKKSAQATSNLETEGTGQLPAVVEQNFAAPIDFDRIAQKPNLLTFAPKPKPPAAAVPNVPGTEFGGVRQANSNQSAAQHLAARRSGPQEVVKVPAELLEELVNLAGETSISRSRMQQQVMDLGGAIGEMDSTIQRLQEQLRRLDIETEAQVVFRQEKMALNEEFDPLEMDRYSQLQQLSRSLMESASDLMDLKYTLADKTRDAETLLLQQSRINTDLQEGLMRSRMVPFSRLVPRLRRIVRQAAIELGKEVDFELSNVEGEMDRTVLERIVAPLEHMLRNAVDHGIESQQERVAAGKPAVGRIALSLSREGGDVLLRLSDDGRGINLARVREKAIERGLIAEDARLSEQDLMQFILYAGFSTADKVTQISGRGVGMDVVHSEIKQLGGSMFIDSRWTQGTEFIVRLPFTVSVNRALMVQVGDDLYAIPLNSIEGIVRVSPFELEHYYQDKLARFDYAGENYLVRYLGNMLDSSLQPRLEGQVLPLPVVLLRSAEVTVALQVDRLLGSREIVVKTLGVQFSAVQGLAGATVMGDGSVVVILDLHALVRQQLALGLGHSVLLEPYQIPTPVEVEESTDKTIMVVDDSVTVRKVTTRFLERENYRVITAKDGIEALQLLQDNIPDVMLLDIEMPRMDGFEVAKNIRTSSRLKDLPIIMITSRTGEKHRERALDLGVDRYMGKPYQEDLLLANIQELIARSQQ
ncbi:MAG TPA: Hpt domain-containing protein [Cellvibrio sp.]|nr:Hpt domain-containing protein [Cellvibrio sp.]